MRPPSQGSIIELDRTALKRNLAFIRRFIGPHAQLCSVVKGNAYGHGLEHFVPLAEEMGVRRFAVFDANEAWRVTTCRRNDDTRVMVMGLVEDGDLEWAVHAGVELYVFDCRRLLALIAAARRVGRPARIHLELETGLNRTGLGHGELAAAAEHIREAGPAVDTVGVCTHLAGAESIANQARIHAQIARFDALCQELAGLGVQPRLRHAACSAATITYPETILDMVRVGILQYGYWPNEETRILHLSSIGRIGDRPLRRVIRWSTRVMAVKQVATGEFIGYGTTYLAPRNMRIAVIPVGYGRGYSRALSNQGRVLVHGKRVGVVGMVNMNHVVVDVTHVNGVAVGDEVVLIGNQGRSTIPVSSFSELSNQLNYELLTRLPEDIPRFVVG